MVEIAAAIGKEEYIEGFKKVAEIKKAALVREYYDVNIPKDMLVFNFQYEGFLARIPSQCIYNAISKKEDKLLDYKTLSGERFDEYWLCIGLPLEERGYSICGASLESNFISDYQRIYITQQLPPKTILLHNK